MNQTSQPCPMCDAQTGETVRNKADIIRCDKCGLVYLRSKPDQAELERHYQMYADNPGSHMKLPATIEAAKASYLRRQYLLNELVEFTGGDRHKLLDIGCGWGAFLDNARDHGFDVRGVEICKRMADYAVNELGINVHQTQVELIPFNDEEIQVVMMIHSLEHLPNQRRALNFIHQIVAPRGYLCGIVPNFASFCSQSMDDNWPWLDPAMHYVHFTPQTLVKALWSCGFNMLRIYTDTGDFDQGMIGREIEKRFGMVNALDKLDQIKNNNEGEEIRFFAQKI